MTDRTHISSVLITGGTGSFGKTMLHDLLDRGIGEVRILSRDEEKQDALRNELRDDRVRYYIGDIRDRGAVDRAVQGVDAIFHAAALKQVPSCEFFPHEAVLTNIIGSENVIRSAAAAKVKSVVCLSTDKAVFPVNAMGMTKALMEKTAQAAARELGPKANTIVSAVRYGNVMYSRGSAIPLFVRQIKAGKPITVPVARIADIAAIMIEELAPGSGMKVEEIGAKPGEKMYEELMNDEEMRRAYEIEEFFVVLPALAGNHEDHYLLVIGWSQLVAPEIFPLVKRALLGMHPTLLPEGRGRAPIPWTILKGLKRSGVSMFKLRPEADSGDIMAAQAFDVDPNETATTLYEKASLAHVALIRKTWPQLKVGTLKGQPQDESKATHWPQRRPEDGKITGEMSLEDIDRLVRATTHPYPGAFLVEDEKRLIIWSGRIIEEEKGRFHLKLLKRGKFCFNPTSYEWLKLN